MQVLKFSIFMFHSKNENKKLKKKTHINKKINGKIY